MSEYHVPVMLSETVNALQVGTGKLYFDGTLGGGGHTGEILRRGGRVIATDRDMEAIDYGDARLFDRIEDVPRKAFTMGLSEIMQAKKILILATGANKADAVFGMVRGEVSEQLPASILRKHADCVLICDDAAGSRLKN